MSWLKFMALGGALGLGLWGCATPGPTVAPAPVKPAAVYFYVGAKKLDLRSAPNPQSPVTAPVTLNERVQKIDQSPAGWFKVRAADGRSGWASERYFKLDPITEFYVNRWGRRLRVDPAKHAKVVTRLRLNDRVKLLEPRPGEWAKVQVQRNQRTGWIESRYLSVKRVAVRRRIRRGRRAAPGKAAEEPAAEAAEEAPAAPSGLAPAPAQAAPPPAKKPTPTGRKARPEMFDRF